MPRKRRTAWPNMTDSDLFASRCHHKASRIFNALQGEADRVINAIRLWIQQ
jgi:hypothetical protein